MKWKLPAPGDIVWCLFPEVPDVEPDEIEFLGSTGQQCKQVGNAFPPMAAETFANAIFKAISNDWNEDSTSNLAYYSLIDKKN